MVDEILDKISGLTLVQAAELVKAMEKKFGVSTAAPVVTNVVGAEGSAPVVVDEKTEFTVVFNSFDGDKKVDAIKKVREITGLPLMDAKKMVESSDSNLKEGVSKDEADKIKVDLEALGCKISLQ